MMGLKGLTSLIKVSIYAYRSDGDLEIQFWSQYN